MKFKIGDKVRFHLHPSDFYFFYGEISGWKIDAASDHCKNYYTIRTRGDGPTELHPSRFRQALGPLASLTASPVHHIYVEENLIELHEKHEPDFYSVTWNVDYLELPKKHEEQPLVCAAIDFLGDSFASLSTIEKIAKT